MKTPLEIRAKVRELELTIAQYSPHIESKSRILRIHSLTKCALAEAQITALNWALNKKPKKK
jgi:hypothetical protein